MQEIGPRMVRRILQVNVTDFQGGAGRVCRSLHDAYLARGLDAWLAAGQVSGGHQVVPIPARDQAGLRAALLGFSRRIGAGGGPVRRQLERFLRMAVHPRRWLNVRLGREDFCYPGTGALLANLPVRPDVVHAHNLGGGFFDLRELPRFAALAPLVLTLHDQWLLTGHCAHGLGCERWQTGCGECPDLTIYPAISADGTATNWRRKQAILEASRPHVVVPSAWLKERVSRSLLAGAARSVTVIPNGIDVTRFSPGDQADARTLTGLPRNALVLLGLFKPRNRFKDFATMQRAAQLVAEAVAPREVALVMVGGVAKTERRGNLLTQIRAATSSDATLVLYYRSADVVLHAAHAENFPMAVLEAMACGRPVIATDVGGIPEQVRTFVRCGAHAPHPRDRATGVLVPGGDAGRMSAAIRLLDGDPDLAVQLGRNAARVAAAQYSLEQQADAQLALFGRIVAGDAPDSRGKKRRA